MMGIVSSKLPSWTKITAALLGIALMGLAGFAVGTLLPGLGVVFITLLPFVSIVVGIRKARSRRARSLLIVLLVLVVAGYVAAGFVIWQIESLTEPVGWTEPGWSSWD